MHTFGGVHASTKAYLPSSDIFVLRLSPTTPSEGCLIDHSNIFHHPSVSQLLKTILSNRINIKDISIRMSSATTNSSGTHRTPSSRVVRWVIGGEPGSCERPPKGPPPRPPRPRTPPRPIGPPRPPPPRPPNRPPPRTYTDGQEGRLVPRGYHMGSTQPAILLTMCERS